MRVHPGLDGGVDCVSSRGPAVLGSRLPRLLWLAALILALMVGGGVEAGVGLEVGGGGCVTVPWLI